MQLCLQLVSGNAGNITVEAEGSANISESSILSNTSGEGNAGSIILKVEKLNINR